MINKNNSIKYIIIFLIMNINDTYIEYNINFINCFRKIFSFIKLKKELKKNKLFFKLLTNKKLIIIQKKKNN